MEFSLAPAGCSLSRSSGSDLVLQHEGRIGAAAAAVLNVYYRPGPRDEAIQRGRVRARLFPDATYKIGIIHTGAHWIIARQCVHRAHRRPETGAGAYEKTKR